MGSGGGRLPSPEAAPSCERTRPRRFEEFHGCGPFVQSNGSDRVDSLRERWCSWCRTRFFLCRSCDRGHRYCSEPCRVQARRASVRAARRRHARSPEGRADHRDRQRSYRQRLRARRAESVTDHGSPSPRSSRTIQSATRTDAVSEVGVSREVKRATNSFRPGLERPLRRRRSTPLRCCRCGKEGSHVVPLGSQRLPGRVRRR